MPEAVLVAAARSPIGRANKGSLKDVRPDDLTAAVVSAVLEKIPALDPAQIDDLYLGCGLPGGESGFNMARIVAVPNAQRVSDFSLLEKTSTVATPIEPDIFRVLARAMSSMPSAGLRKLTLISTVTPILPLGRAEVTAIPAA